MLGNKWKPKKPQPFKKNIKPIEVDIEPKKVIIFPDKNDSRISKTLSDIEQKSRLFKELDDNYKIAISKLEEIGWREEYEDVARKMFAGFRKRYYKSSEDDPNLD
jgi:hypothetical protein